MKGRPSELSAAASLIKAPTLPGLTQRSLASAWPSSCLTAREDPCRQVSCVERSWLQTAETQPTRQEPAQVPSALGQIDSCSRSDLQACLFGCASSIVAGQAWLDAQALSLGLGNTRSCEVFAQEPPQAPGLVGWPAPAACP